MKMLSNCRVLITVLTTMHLTLAGCASYRVSEADIQHYLKDQEQIEHSLGIAGLAQATIALSDIQVGIGRVAADRINVSAIADALLAFSGQEQKKVQIDLNFSAIPYYSPKEGAIFMNNIRTEGLQVTPDELGLFSNTLLLAPIVDIIGQLLSTQAVYRLNESDFRQSCTNCRPL